MKGKIKTRLIHILGGYTQQEYDKLRFAPMPVIKKETVYPVTVTELVPELSKLVRCTGPTYIAPGQYGFSVSITVIPPLDYAEGECLSE